MVDLEPAHPRFRIDIAPAGASYVFNPAGQAIGLAGLLCLFGAAGPCANAVRDAQRTKTRPETVATLSVIGGTADHEERLREAQAWYRSLLDEAGATTREVS